MYLGIDTSNYTTSAAVYESGQVKQEKQLLPVKPGEKGLRQSDAVFHHTVQLPQILQNLFEKNTFQKLEAIGASAFPRRLQGSYMPCFLVGSGFARSAAALLSVPYFEFSHQEGHVAAALYSANRISLLQQPFLAFHLSGGTTDALLVTPSRQHIMDLKLVAKSLDLKAGQLIDRVGLLLGLSFPCGPALQDLALQSQKTYRLQPTIKNLDCCLSGIENQCQNLLQMHTPPEDIAQFCLCSIIAAVDAMLTGLLSAYDGLPIVFSGGVASNLQMQTYFKNKYEQVYFAEPVFSADNAAGISVLTAMMKERTAL